MKKHRISKCKLCRAEIKKGNEKYYEANKVCQRCWDRLKNPLTERVRTSWMTKLIEELSLRSKR
jgi:recombinational DNA repair protein (RecF pathway)